MTKPEGTRWKQQLKNPDWVFGLLLLGFLAVIGKRVMGSADAAPAVTIASVAIIGALIASFGSRLDRRMIEDFHYRLLQQASVVAVVTVFLAAGFFELVRGDANVLTAKDMILILTGSWATGYFFHRFRGLDT